MQERKQEEIYKNEEEKQTRVLINQQTNKQRSNECN